MSMRVLVALALVAVVGLALWAWSHNTTPPPAAAPGMPVPSGDGPRVVVESGGDPGVTWQVPGRWGQAESNPMRLATYSVPAAKGDRDETRCAVYYFGPGQGGDTHTNVERWISEFEEPAKPERLSRTVDGLPLSTVRVRGTHLAHVDMSGDNGVRQHQELYGAIVETPNGSVFFKLTGPERTVDAAAAEFDRMLGSLKKK